MYWFRKRCTKGMPSGQKWKRESFLHTAFYEEGSVAHSNIIHQGQPQQTAHISHSKHRQLLHTVQTLTF